MARQDGLQMELFDIISITEMLILHQVYKKLLKESSGGKGTDQLYFMV